MTSAQLARTILPRHADPEVFTRGAGWIASLWPGGGVAPPELVALPPIVVRFEHHANIERDIVSTRQRPAFEIEVVLVAFPPATAAGEPLWAAFARASTAPMRVAYFRCDRDADPRRAVVTHDGRSSVLVERWSSRHAGASGGAFQFELLTHVFRALGAGDSTPLQTVGRRRAGRPWLWIVGVLAGLALVVGGWALFVARSKDEQKLSRAEAEAETAKLRDRASAIPFDKAPAFACTAPIPRTESEPSLVAVMAPAAQGYGVKHVGGLRHRANGRVILGHVAELGSPEHIAGDAYSARMSARIGVEVVEGAGTPLCTGIVSGSFLVSTTSSGIETYLPGGVENLVRLAVCRKQSRTDCAVYERGGVELAP